MVVGSALGSVWSLLYAFTFDQFSPSNPLLLLANLISTLGRLTYILGFVMAVIGVVRTFRFADSRWADLVRSVTTSPPDALRSQFAALGSRKSAISPVMVGLAVFLLGQVLVFAGAFVPLLLSGSLAGLQSQFVIDAIGGVVGALGLFLIFYGIGAYLSRA